MALPEIEGKDRKVTCPALRCLHSIRQRGFEINDPAAAARGIIQEIPSVGITVDGSVREPVEPPEFMECR